LRSPLVSASGAGTSTGCSCSPSTPSARPWAGWPTTDGGAATGCSGQRHLDDPQAAGPGLVLALRELLELPEPDWTYVQRWSLARPSQPREQAFHLGPARIGLCGDGWGSPRFETAWMSGTALGRQLARELA
jgi:predicted NAD/FAD-dependent oxidoreductase